jgi:CRP-like cAMP-binding protein
MLENPYLTKVTRTFQELEVIFEEGNYGDEMYIVHSGLVKLVKQSTGREIVIASIPPGEFFGEMAAQRRGFRFSREVVEEEFHPKFCKDVGGNSPRSSPF